MHRSRKLRGTVMRYVMRLHQSLRGGDYFARIRLTQLTSFDLLAPIAGSKSCLTTWLFRFSILTSTALQYRRLTLAVYYRLSSANYFRNPLLANFTAKSRACCALMKFFSSGRRDRIEAPLSRRDRVAVAPPHNKSGMKVGVKHRDLLCRQSHE